MTRLNLSLAVLMVANVVVFAPAMLLDTRMLDSAPVWIKAQKFHISLALHFFTIALLAQQIPRAVRNGPVLIAFSYAAAFALLSEYIWVGIQAARARRSHFNLETGFEGLMVCADGAGCILVDDNRHGPGRPDRAQGRAFAIRPVAWQRYRSLARLLFDPLFRF